MTSLPPDPYKALGVSKDAQIAEIRTAYRKLVLKCHPDKVQDPALKAQKADEFQKVQQAYELLNSEKERQRYDDQVRLAELREAMRAKANSSAPRATASYKYTNVNIHTAEPRPSTFKPGSPPTAKSYSYSRSYEESASRSFEERTPPRRESTHSEKSKRESEREKEREKERREKEKDKERRRKEKAERAEKEAKRAEKKSREKTEEKERRRNHEDKKKPYIETYEEEPPREKRRSSRKHEEKRDRSTHRDEIPIDSIPPPPVPSMPHASSYSEQEKMAAAASYIEAAKAKKLYRDFAPPSAPTPPPVTQSGPFSPPGAAAPVEEPEVHRSGKSRRGSSGAKSSYERKTSHEVLNDLDDVAPSPSARHAQRTATAAAVGSPPKLGRQNTAPAEAYSGRAVPPLSRATTYSGEFTSDSRGRNRSRHHAQIPESESEEDYERKHSSRKHRSSKKEPRPSEYVNTTYKISSDGRATMSSSYSRSMEPEHETYTYYTHHGPGGSGVHVVESRPVPGRETSYSRSAGGSYPKFPKVHTSKSYDVDDIAYSHYPATYQDEYTTAYA